MIHSNEARLAFPAILPRCASVLVATWLAGLAIVSPMAMAATRPNIIFILCDNLGNGDIRCFNPSSPHRTPHLDQMAKEGMRLTSYYAASGVCTPSRAAFMTGCYPRRVNMHLSDKGGWVLQPVAAKGLNPSETTIAEVLKSVGYATTIFGKWHLGDQPEFLPTRQGFDSYLGIPYSDDMVQSKNPEVWPPLPLMRNEKVIDAPVDLPPLTKRYTEEAIQYISDHRQQPFFLFFSHVTPGSTPTSFSGEAFANKSANGAWGDSVEEIDWSAGEILAAVKRFGLDDNTLIIWTSDNGAPQRKGIPHGSNLPYQGNAYSTSEAGMRMPCIVRWPGTVPADRECRELCSKMDWLPTFARITGAKLPEQPIDGHDIFDLLLDKPGVKSPYDARGFFYYQVDQLQCVRSGPWKLYLPLESKRINAAKREAAPIPRLYNVVEDVAEEKMVAEQNPEIVARLMKLADQARAELGDNDLEGTGQRPAGYRPNPIPQTLSAGSR